MNKVKALILAIIIMLFVTSCSYVPKVAKKQKYAENCELFTKKLILSEKESIELSCENIDDLGSCIFKHAVFMPAGSFLVSGSIVLVGNTLHWLEYQGRCDDGIILKMLKEIKKI